MRLLFTTFEGGGHVPPLLLVADLMRRRGHAVLVISDEANRAQATSRGLAFQSWRRAPNRTVLGAADDPLTEWRARWPPGIVRRVCDAVICGPAAAYAADTLTAIDAFQPDVVVSNELLFGAMMAAERRRTPLALLTANIWCFPTRTDVPPFGPGFPPARTSFEVNRERAARSMIAGWYRAHLQRLNEARGSIGLPPLHHALQQLEAAHVVLLGTSRAFDYGAAAAAPFVYVGPLAESPAWVDKGDVSALLDETRPNILVSFSTAYQAQEKAVGRCIEALSRLDVHGVATLGPALDPAALPRVKNVTIVQSASHEELLPRCAAVVSHGGHGSIIRPLMHGVPVVCVPTGRDQPENAERIAWAGAGLRLSRRAGRRAIAHAVSRVLAEPSFAQAARRTGAAIAREADGGLKAAHALEALVLNGV